MKQTNKDLNNCFCIILIRILIICAGFGCFDSLTAMGSEKNCGQHFEVPEGDAIETLCEAAQQANVEIFFSAKVVRGVRTPSVSGVYTPLEVFRRMLQSTPLVVFNHGESGVYLVKMSEKTDVNPIIKNKMNDSLKQKRKSFVAAIIGAFVALGSSVTNAQEYDSKDEDIYELSPFEIISDENVGYLATSSLAGSRINTDLKDVASAISVVTKEFFEDTGSADLEDILVYQTNTEVAGLGGNFYGSDANDAGYKNQLLVNPQRGTRIRGLNTADLTRNFFASNIPIDSYNTDRLDIQRGSNSILFGLGSPAGIINATLHDAIPDKMMGQIQVSINNHNSIREIADVNIPLIKNRLAVRVVGLNDEEKFRQDYTYEDDRRVYAAFKWKPKLADTVYTQFDAKIESGDIKANRPVFVTAADFISNWFGPLNKYLMYDPIASNGIPTDPNGVQHRELSHYFSGAPARDWWNASAGTIFQNPENGVIGNGNLDAYRQRDGSPWGGLSGVTNPNFDDGGTGIWNKNTSSYYANNPVISKLISQYEESTGKQFSGFGGSLWPVQMILDGPLAFIDRTIQGPNKKEWNKFDSVDLSLTQTFLNGITGYNVSYYQERYDSGYTNAISTNRVSIDVNTTLRDGSSNPDVGRPVIIGPSSGQSVEEDRRAFRATLFAKVNLEDYMERNFLTALFGEQTFTGVYTSQRFENFNRYYSLYAWDGNSYARKFMDWDSHLSWWGIHYIGDSLQSVNGFENIPSSAIQGVSTIHEPNSQSNTLVWDNYTQSWHNASTQVLNYKDNLESLYNGVNQGYDTTDSYSFVWQGKLLNDAIVPLFGWRQDEYERWDKPNTIERDDFNIPLPYDPEWNYDESTPITAKEERRSWGLVLHADKILNMFGYEMPEGITFSLNYNESNSFRPSEVGTDIYGKKLGSPSGETTDYGFLLTAFDNKLALRVTWYETIQKNTLISDPAGMRYWAKAGVVRTMNALAQEIWGSQRDNPTQTTPEWVVNEWFFGKSYDNAVANKPLPADWRDQMDELMNQPLRIRRAAVEGSATYVAQGDVNPETSVEYLAPPLDAEEVAYREAWFAARSDLEWFRPLDMDWVNSKGFEQYENGTWGIWGEGSPGGQQLTNDLISEGVEFELTVNPTSNWRVTFNASRASAERSNVVSDWAEFIEKNSDFWFEGYDNNPGGPSQLNYWTIDGISDIRHWAGSTMYSSVADTFGGRMMQNVFGPYYNAIAQNGQSVNELRKWRFNFVTNYQFDDGLFKDVNVGCAYRWQDKAAIGYYPKYNELADIWITDASRPIYGPSEDNFDIWVGYRRKLTNKIDWKVQFNVRNLFADDDLIPISANPDGTIAQVRIPNKTQWTLTNTFSF